MTEETMDMTKWQRLSPLSFIHFIVTGIVAFIKHGVQAAVPAFAAIVAFGENAILYVSLAVTGIVIFIIVASILGYFKFYFRITDNTVYIRQGVLTRKRLSLSFDRIQNVSLKEPIYFRPFNLVSVVIESAGSTGEEVGLGGIPRSLAEDIRATVMGHQRAAKLELNENTLEDEIEEEEIITQPIGELVRYGLTNNNVWVIAGLIAGALGQLDWDEYAFDDQVQEQFMSLVGNDTTMIALYGFLSFITLFAVLLGLSVLATIIVHYNYRLTRSEGRFHRTKGLFERQETSLLEQKIQAITVKQNWIAGLLKRFTITISQVGFVDKNKDPGAAMKAGKKFFIPSAENAFVRSFSRLLYPDFNWTEKPLKPIERAFIRKILIWVVFPISLIPAVNVSLVTGSPLGLLPLLAPLLAWPIVTQIHKRYGYAKNDTHGVVRKGFIGRQYTVFPLHKVQTVEVKQSPGQRLKGLATITIKLAAANVTIPYIPHADAIEWRRDILNEMKRSNTSWM